MLRFALAMGLEGEAYCATLEGGLVCLRAYSSFEDLSYAVEGSGVDHN